MAIKTVGRDECVCSKTELNSVVFHPRLRELRGVVQAAYVLRKIVVRHNPSTCTAFLTVNGIADDELVRVLSLGRGNVLPRA